MRQNYNIIRFVSSMRRIILVFLITSTVFVPVAARASDTRTIRPEADAKVIANTPEENFGDTKTIAADGSPEIESYLRFVVGNLAGIPRRATLRLWAITGTGDLPTIALASNDWSEREVTWNKRPARTTKNKIYEGGTSADRWVEFDVTSFVRGNGTYTFLMNNDSGDRLTMASRESDRSPELIVEAGDGSDPAPSPTPKPPTPSGDEKTWFVAAGAASGGSGQSEERAWKELDRIQWSRIRPGDTIRVKQGTYRETLEVDANGSKEKPIRILFEPGSVLFGGRSTTLPECGQQSYSYRAGGRTGIDLGDASNIVIDGQQWDGVKVNGWQHGIEMDKAQNITIRNMEIVDNGTAEREGGRWNPRSHGVQLGAVRAVLFDRVNIHDNGADGIHAYDNIVDVTLRDTWLHNDRGSSFNGCGHPDGLQMNSGYSGKDITFQRVVSGPGIYHTILSNAGGENWRFEDVLAFDPITSTFACRGDCRSFTFNRITSDGRNGRLNFELSGSGHRIVNSLVTNGNNKLPSGITLENNYQYGLDGDRVGTSRDPDYRDPQNGDYTPRADVNGAGSRVTSAKQLLESIQQQSVVNVYAERSVLADVVLDKSTPESSSTPLNTSSEETKQDDEYTTSLHAIYAPLVDSGNE